MHITIYVSVGDKRKPIKKLESDINSDGGWYILSNQLIMMLIRIFSSITLFGLFLVSTAPTAPPSDLPNTTILDVSMSVL